MTSHAIDDATNRRVRETVLGAPPALWERSVRATNEFVSTADIELFRPLVRQGFASDALEVWVLIDSAGISIDFLGVTGNAIEAPFLEPGQLRRGLGSGLVAHAQELSGSALTVEVNEQNAAARAFYERLGFGVIGRSKLDGTGRPYPLLHLHRAAPLAESNDRTREGRR